MTRAYTRAKIALADDKGNAEHCLINSKQVEVIELSHIGVF